MHSRSESNGGRADEHLSITEGIVTRVASATDREATELPPLYEVVDPEALERFIKTGSANEAALSVTFNYAGQRITIGPDRAVHVAASEK